MEIPIIVNKKGNFNSSLNFILQLLLHYFEF